MKNKRNYVKLTAYGPASMHDAEAASKAPSDHSVRCVVSWVFPFTSKGEGSAALLAAQVKRTALRAVYQDADYQLSTWAPSHLRGVPLVGEPLKSLPAEDSDEAPAVAS